MQTLKESVERNRRAAAEQSYKELTTSIACTCLRLKGDGVELTAARVGRELGRFGEHPRFMRAFRDALRLIDVHRGETGDSSKEVGHAR
jgi:hypothetical protein